MRLVIAQFAVLTAAALVASLPASADESAPSGNPVAVYTQDNAPATPVLDSLALKEFVSEYGITWTFAKPARAGRFINGDWYVVGPVTVVKIDRLPPPPPPPLWQRGR